MNSDNLLLSEKQIPWVVLWVVSLMESIVLASSLHALSIRGVGLSIMQKLLLRGESENNIGFVEGFTSVLGAVNKSKQARRSNKVMTNHHLSFDMFNFTSIFSQKNVGTINRARKFLQNVHHAKQQLRLKKPAKDSRILKTWNVCN